MITCPRHSTRSTTRSLAPALWLTGLALLPIAASAQQAYTRSETNLRAGPSANYPVVARLGVGQPLDVVGCTNGYGWCDVALPDGLRGWLYASGLDYAYDGSRVPLMSYGAVIGIPIVGFAVGSYWSRYYRDRPWYGDRRWWGNRPPPPAFGWSRPAYAGPGWQPRQFPGPGFGPGVPGYRPGYVPGNGPGFQPGYAPGYHPGYRPGSPPGYRPGPQPRYQAGPPPGVQPGFRPGPPGQSVQPGYGPGYRPGYRPGEGPRSPGVHPGFAGGGGPGARRGFAGPPPGARSGAPMPGFRGAPQQAQGFRGPGPGGGGGHGSGRHGR